MGGRMERFPLEPLWRQAELQWGTAAESGRYGRVRSGGPNAGARPFSAVVLAEMVGVPARAVERWKADGGLTYRHAEQAAQALGFAFAELWPPLPEEGGGLQPDPDDPLAALGLAVEARAWMRRAACRFEDPDVFFPDVTYKRGARQPSGADIARVNAASAPARLICSSCPVRADCLDYALALGPSLDGVWGGTVAHERHALRRQAEAS